MGQPNINTKAQTLSIQIRNLTVQLDGESVFHVHTARLGNPPYCGGILL